MAERNLARDSLIVFIMVVLSAYSAGLLLNSIFGRGQATPGDLLLVGSLVAVVAGLGFMLQRIVKFEDLS